MTNRVPASSDPLTWSRGLPMYWRQHLELQSRLLRGLVEGGKASRPADQADVNFRREVEGGFRDTRMAARGR